MTNVTAGAYADIPLFLFHLLEFMDVDYTVDVDEINERWRELAAVDVWAQLIMKEPNDARRAHPRRAARPARYRLAEDGRLSFVGVTNDWHDVTHEDECFFLRVYGPGDYRFKGADLGILVTKGRMQTDDGLTEALPQLHRRHPLDVCERAAARAPERDTHRLRQVAARLSCGRARGPRRCRSDRFCGADASATRSVSPAACCPAATNARMVSSR